MCVGFLIFNTRLCLCDNRRVMPGIFIQRWPVYFLSSYCSIIKLIYNSSKHCSITILQLASNLKHRTHSGNRQTTQQSKETHNSLLPCSHLSHLQFCFNVIITFFKSFLCLKTVAHASIKMTTLIPLLQKNVACHLFLINFYFLFLINFYFLYYQIINWILLYSYFNLNLF